MSWDNNERVLRIGFAYVPRDVFNPVIIDNDQVAFAIRYFPWLEIQTVHPIGYNPIHEECRIGVERFHDALHGYRFLQRVNRYERYKSLWAYPHIVILRWNCRRFLLRSFLLRLAGCDDVADVGNPLRLISKLLEQIRRCNRWNKPAIKLCDILRPKLK